MSSSSSNHFLALLCSCGGCCVVGVRVTMMDGRDLQHLDLIMRHQSMGLNLCDSEEALGSSESEPAKPARPRGKRSRAAEVHNLSEKRRRSRINEKMKSLQSLIPNSSKTDKASMLDDAIEYLKQLQLQVQMLSTRNGLYLPPVNLSGAPEPLPASQMCAAFNQNSDKASNPPSILLPVNQISGARHSFDPPYHNQRHHKSLVLPSVPNTTTPDPQFLLESSQSNLHSFQLTVSAEMIFQDDVMLKRCLSSAQETTSVPARDVVSQPSQEEALDQAQDQEIEEYEIIEVENPQACITATLSRSEGRIKVTLQSEKLTAGLF